MKSLYMAARWCQWVEPNAGATGENKNVLFYRNRNGLGVPPAKLEAQVAEKRRAMIVDDSE